MILNHCDPTSCPFQMEEQLRNPQKKEKKKKNPKINDYETRDDRRGMTRPVRAVPEFHKKKGECSRYLIERKEQF